MWFGVMGLNDWLKIIVHAVDALVAPRTLNNSPRFTGGIALPCARLVVLCNNSLPNRWRRTDPAWLMTANVSSFGCIVVSKILVFTIFNTVFDHHRHTVAKKSSVTTIAERIQRQMECHPSPSLSYLPWNFKMSHHRSISLACNDRLGDDSPYNREDQKDFV
ncbi:hypothetical protein CEXT_204541 [Caerostris extrusa]|uniref:Uncharacterized protein n=1 Tax=Caerostris extrusa TaxID=172846 RepID=A0AAV4MTE9_CAEEX|nr:hypothetical protein CEXT_204541 [Caerostris extrusa]